jgi:hypothetical protein
VTCREIDNLLQDFIDEKLSPADYEMVAGHYRSCSTCAGKYQDALAVIHELKKADVPPASADFASRAIARATRADQRPSVRVPGRLSAGIAASLVMLALIAVFFSLNITDQDNAVVLLGGEVKVIKVAIDSVHAIDGVKMTIDISENLEISGYEDQKIISWNADLKKGTNVIALPISAIARGEGEITTRVRLNDKVKIFKIKTRSNSIDKVQRGYKLIMEA